MLILILVYINFNKYFCNMDEHILYEKKFYRMCLNIIKKPEHKILYKDLHQESVIVITIKKYNITEINSRGELPYLFSRVAWMTYRSNAFRKQYGINIETTNEIKDTEDIEYDDSNDLKEDALFCELFKAKTNEKDEYLDLLFQRYLEEGESGLKVSEKYGIPISTIYHSLNELREKYKKIYENTGLRK